MTENDLRNLDWASNWDRLRPIVESPESIQILDMVMEAHCQKHGKTWDRTRGPFHCRLVEYQNLMEPVTTDSHWWYHCPGGCHAINAWAGWLGQQLRPDLDWYIFCRHPQHAAAVGFAEYPDEPRLLMDLAWWYVPSTDPLAQHVAAIETLAKLFEGDGPKILHLNDYLDAFRQTTSTN